MSLLNHKKGDRYLIAVPPPIVAKGSIDSRLRQRPRSWVLLEIEICKVKDGSKDKKEKKD